MKFTYQITKEFALQKNVRVQYLPDSNIATPDEFEVNIPDALFDLDDAERKAAINKLILSKAPVDRWQVEINNYELERIKNESFVDNFNISGVIEEVTEADTADIPTIKADIGAESDESDWSESIKLARKELKANRDSMTSEELGAHLRKVLETEAISVMQMGAK